jgi:hypothetical protein
MPRTPVAARARDVVKAVTRATGVATAGLRPPPDFLIIGTKRGGTTSFYFDLIAHPSYVRLFPPPLPVVKPDATKGVHYFDTNYPRGHRWYRSFMPTKASRLLAERRTSGPVVAGEASPYYLFHPMAAERAHAEVPGARIIVLLRDPVSRTHSHWKERRRQSAEPMDFVDALAAEPGRLAGERERLIADPAYVSYPWEQQSYALQSEYAGPLGRWVELFGPDRVHVAVSEEYYADPARVLGDVDDFLGVPRRSASTGEIRNAAEGSPLPSDLEQELRARFAPANRELEQLTGRTYPWPGPEK